MKQTKQEVFPIHKLISQTSLGIEFHDMNLTHKDIETLLKLKKHLVHRDDYYTFLVFESVDVIFSIDFEEIKVQDQSIFYIRPYQVHYGSSFHQMKGWSLSIDSSLIESHYKNIFEEQLLTQKAISIDKFTLTRLEDTARLLSATIQAAPTAFSNGIINNLANVFIGIIAEQYAENQEYLLNSKSRAALIAYQFKKMLAVNFKTIKSPTQYAQNLNYSLSHLNESVKTTTGFPVSYWIHQQIILEAKRMLYHTDMDVKEIAFSLGYEDHTYFSRLFSKQTGMSPNAFRRKFRE